MYQNFKVNSDFFDIFVLTQINKSADHFESQRIEIISKNDLSG